MRRRRLIGAAASTAVLAVAAAILLFPVALTVFTSLKPPHEIITAEPMLFPKEPTLDNYVRLFGLRSFETYLTNSFLVASLTAVTATAAAGVAAYGIVWLRMPGRRAVTKSLLLTYMFPEIILVIPLFIMCYELGILDSRFTLVLVYVAFTLPFSVWLVKLFFESVPPGPIEAARLDGASELQCMARILLPMSLPVLTTVFVLAFVLGWSEYLYANTLITSDSNRTMAVGLQTLIGYHRTDYGLLTAAGVVMVLPILALFLSVQRYLLYDLHFGDLRR